MSVPPPPPAFVPPPPPTATVPQAPNAVPTPAPPVAVVTAKAGGISLDLSNVFGPAPGKPKALPPWERRSKAASAGPTPPPPLPMQGHKRPVGSTAASPANPPLTTHPKHNSPLGGGDTGSGCTTPPPPQLHSALAAPPLSVAAVSPKVGTSLPSLHSGTDAQPSLAHSPTPLPARPLSLAVPVSLSAAQVGQPAATEAAAAAPTAMSVLSGPSVAPPPPPVPSAAPAPPALAPVPSAVTAAPPQPSGAGTAAAVIAPPPPPTTTTGAAGVTAAAQAPVPVAAAPPPLPLAPTTEVVVPASTLFTFNGEPQHVLVPAAPKPGRLGSRAKPSATAALANRPHAKPTEPRWRNRYDFQPSPSAQLHHTQALAVHAQSSSTTRRVGHEAAAANDWRGVYWKNVDVHRYVARRYFGIPPPTEK